MASQVRLEILMTKSYDCPSCDGTGKTATPDKSGNDRCPVCQGTGKADISNLERDIVQ